MQKFSFFNFYMSLHKFSLIFSWCFHINSRISIHFCMAPCKNTWKNAKMQKYAKINLCAFRGFKLLHFYKQFFGHLHIFEHIYPKIHDQNVWGPQPIVMLNNEIWNLKLVKTLFQRLKVWGPLTLDHVFSGLWLFPYS